MQIVDLSRPLDPAASVYPGDPPVEREAWATHAADGYRVARLSLGTHAGTHVDAPAHTEPDPEAVVGDAYTIDDYPAEAFRFRARLVDLTDLDAREAITREALPALDSLPTGLDLLVLRTGWGDHWGTDRYRDHPYLAADAAAALADRGLAVGLDSFGPDPTPPADADPATVADEPDGVPAHRALLGAGLPIVENLRLDELAAAVGQGEEFVLCAYPLLVVDGDAAPCRAVAEVG